MDPSATWSELLQALVNEDWPVAREAAEVLLEWLRKGGFAPRIVRSLPAEHPWHRAFAQTVCQALLQAAEESVDGTC